MSCDNEDKEVSATFVRTDQMMESDSAQQALTLLCDMESKVADLPRSQQMRYHLLQAKAQNKAAVNFTTDSVMKPVVAYYDRHGNHNDRLLAHYLLGCVYRDLGEAPQALACYQDAVDCADTTDTNCDYKTLYCVYAQQAYIYKSQLLFSLEVQDLRQASHFALLAKDTITSIYCQELMAGAYILLNKTDSAEATLLSVVENFRRYGCTQKAATASKSLIYLYVRKAERQNEAKRLMDIYESESSDVNKEGNLFPSQRQYYSYKGRYYEQMGKLDSAEYYYRKIYRSHMNYTAKDPMYRGLLSIFTKRHQADSIAKYALLYCEANDSSIAIKDRELTAQMAAQYNYSRAQRIAAQQETRAERAHRIMWMFIALAFVLAASIIALWHRFRRHRRSLYEALEDYHQKVKQLNLLETSHKRVIELVCQDLKSSQGESDKYRKKLEHAQQEMIEINALHEQNVTQQKEEIARLKTKIEELQRKSGLVRNLNKANDLKNSEIVKWFFHQVQHQKFDFSDYDRTTLIKEFATYYPTLLDDLHTMSLKQNAILVCVLVILKFREKDIASILHLSVTGVSNLKSEINFTLFNEKSSRSLYKNLEHRYGLFL